MRGDVRAPVRGCRAVARSRLTRVLRVTSNSYQQQLLVMLVGTGCAGTATPLQGDGAPKAPRSEPPGLISIETVTWTVTATIVLITATAVAAMILRRHALTGRTVQRVLLPSPRFEPTSEEVDRFAAVLSRTHRATRLPGTREAHAVRIRISSGADGLVRYHLEGHQRAQSVLTMAGYDQVESLPAAATAIDSVSVDDETAPEEPQ